MEKTNHSSILVPVKPHLYHLMVRENSRSGALQSLSENLAQVRSMKLDQLGFPEGTRMPDSRQMEQIRLCLRKMQHHYSPLKKLENLLRALSHVISRPAPVPVGKRHQSAGDLSSAAFGGKSKKLPPADGKHCRLFFGCIPTSDLSIRPVSVRQTDWAPLPTSDRSYSPD